VLVEDYLEERTPDVSSFNISINGVDDFIYRSMIDARPGSFLATQLLKGGNTLFSIPFIYSKIRGRLQADIDAFDAAVADFDRRIAAKKQAADDCGLLDFSCSKTVLLSQAAGILAEKSAFQLLNGPGY